MLSALGRATGGYIGLVDMILEQQSGVEKSYAED